MGSNAIAAIGTLTDLTTFLSFLASRIAETSALIQQAQTEGRDLTPDEMASIEVGMHKAHQDLKDLIKQKS